MTRLLSSLTIILFTLCVLSCKKPTEDDPSDTPSGSTLTKVMVWNTAQPQKSIQITEFKFDNLNRVTEVVYSSGDSLNGNINANILRTKKCFYTGNETRPDRTTNFALPLGYPAGDVYHYHNTSGVLTADSTGDWDPYTGYYKREFTWSADKVIKTLSDTYSGSLKQTKDTLFIDANNITGYTVRASSRIDEYSFKYDDKVNPLSRLNIAAFLVVDGTDGIDGPVAPGYCKNNVAEMSKKSVEILDNGTSTSSKKVAFIYKYNSNGLPVERIMNADKSTITRYYYKEN